MGSGDWLKNIVSVNRARKQKSNKMKDFSHKEAIGFILQTCYPEDRASKINKKAIVSWLSKDRAAIRIQTAFRAFKARKLLCVMKRTERLQILMQGDFGKKQTSNTLRNLQSWNKIQAHIRTRRVAMVEESGIKQKKLDNQLKLDAKSRGLELEWSGSSHTMDEALARQKQREEATIKRERAMAYAFNHQWRAHSSSNSGLNDSNLATSNWGWSWTERWIAVRPWERRAPSVSTPKKVNSSPRKKSPSTKKSNSLKTSPNGKKTLNNRRLSYGSSAKVGDSKTKL